MASPSDEIFVLAISETLSQWKSFQLAVENGMGGNDAKEKLTWMIEVIAKFFKDNKDLMCDEVVDFVAEIIDNEFDTIIEDGSLEMLASSLCRYYQLCSSGREEEVRKRLDDIRRLNSCNNVSNNSVRNDNQSAVENRMQFLNIDDREHNEQESNDNEGETENSGWTLVQRKHKR